MKIRTIKIITSAVLSVLLVVVYLLPYRAYLSKDYYQTYLKYRDNYEESKRVFYQGKWVSLTHTERVTGGPYGLPSYYDIYKDSDGNEFIIRRDTGKITGIILSSDEEEEAKKTDIPNPSEAAIEEAKKYLISLVGPVNALFYRTEIDETEPDEYTVLMTKFLGGVATNDSVKIIITPKGTLSHKLGWGVGDLDFSIATQFQIELATDAILKALHERFPGVANFKIVNTVLKKTVNDGITFKISYLSETYDENGELHSMGFPYEATVEFRPKTIAMTAITAVILLLWVPSGLAWAFGRIGRRKKKVS